MLHVLQPLALCTLLRHAANSSRHKPLVIIHLSVQPFAPCATALEGTLLGALEIKHIAGRTVLSAGVSCAFLYWASGAGLGLTGVWIGLCLVTTGNLFSDAWKIMSQGSPVRQQSAGPPDKH